MGTATKWGKPRKKDLDMIYGHFPPLVPRRNRPAGYCGGGELLMIVMGPALMARREAPPCGLGALQSGSRVLHFMLRHHYSLLSGDCP